ncbi:MAG: nucleotidyltransferase family protein [Pseudomonadota bacterium]
MTHIDAIILAGGLGTRLRPVLNDAPKALARINDHPFLDYLLAQLSHCPGLRKVVLAVGYLSEQVVDRYMPAEKFRFSIDFSVETQLLGTAGAVKQAISRTSSSHVLVMNGDSYLDFDFDKFIKSASSRPDVGWIAVKHMDNTRRYGSVILEKDGRISAFREKEQSSGGGYINAGVYLLPRDIIDAIPANKAASLEKELFPTLCAEGRLYGHRSTGEFIDIGTPESYQRATDFFKTRLLRVK